MIKLPSINLGAWVNQEKVCFRVWAPMAKQVEVVFENQHEPLMLTKDDQGYFTAETTSVKPGDLYKYRMDKGQSYPDPCSRFQPQGPHGPSMIVDSRFFSWKDQQWQKKGIQLKGHVIYELHVGIFSSRGDYQGVIDQLAELKRFGITAIELMPLSECPGRWNWGYDGVGLYAPYHVYGKPDDLRLLIDEAHRLGLAVILDVVYNHLGPDGNYLAFFSKDYFTDRYKNEWGEAINFDGPHSQGVREFFIQNACYWINEFHFDGLRLDATQSIYDQSDCHVLAEMSKRVRELASPKQVLLIAENEAQDVTLVQPLEKGGYGLDALWNDDFHHIAQVALSGAREAYYTDYTATPQEFITSVKQGFLYQGQYYQWQNQNRGSYVDDSIPAASFVTYLENHDQVSNSLLGKRIHSKTDAGIYRALTGLFLLSPQTPLLFMGQEFGASSPFVFFTDHNKELGPKVFAGRKEFLSQFPSIKAAVQKIQDPQNEETYRICKLNWQERLDHKEIYQMHYDLLKLRREDEVFQQQDRRSIDGVILGSKTFAIRYRGKDSDRLLIVNLGETLNLCPCPYPLLVPPSSQSWRLLWSSEDVHYQGQGTVDIFKSQEWTVQARCTQVFGSEERKTNG